MFKSLKELAVPLEKNLASQLIRELAHLEKLTIEGDDIVETETIGSLQLAYRTLSSGRRVYCPNRQNPARNRKHLVRSLLIH